MTFKDEIIDYLGNVYKGNSLGLSKCGFDTRSKTYKKHILCDEDANNNFQLGSLSWKDVVKERTENSLVLKECEKFNQQPIKLHTYWRRLNSSQVMCINFFYRLLAIYKDEDFLRKIIKEALNIEIKSPIVEYQFELIENQKEKTSFDFYLKTKDGEKIYWEIKYTENNIEKYKNVDENQKNRFKEIYKEWIHEGINHDYFKNVNTTKDFYSLYQINRCVSYVKSNNDYFIFVVPKKNKKFKETLESSIIGKAKNIGLLYWEDILKSLMEHSTKLFPNADEELFCDEFMKKYFYKDYSNVKIKIIRGTNQIGGCITEISTRKSKIIIDFGEEISDKKNKNKHVENDNDIRIEGLTYGKPQYDAVFITHSHEDHIGLVDKILPTIPVYVEKDSRKIFEISNDFKPIKYRKHLERVNFKNVEFEIPIIIKNITITYFRIDHSAYNSASVLIETEGKRILHTGDFRNNGRKGEEFEDTIKRIGQVDYLITEGTSLSRKNEKNQTEKELEKELITIFKKYNQIFVLQSSTNIDRLVTMFRVAKATNKNFVEDLCTANIATELGKEHKIPNPFFETNTPYIWSPLIPKKNLDYDKYYEPLKHRCQNEAVHGDFCMLVKPSMYLDIKKAIFDKGYASNAHLIYSMWEGYLEDSYTKSFVENLKKLGITYDIKHVSGHADIETLKLMHKLTNPKEKTIVIHTENKAKAKEIFGNYSPLEDGDYIEI